MTARKRKKAERARKIKQSARRGLSLGSGISFPTLRRMYDDACQRAREEYPNLLGIHECLPHVYRQPPEELLRCFQYEKHKQRFWDIDKDDYIEQAKSKGNFAGHVSILSDGQCDRPVVFILQPTDMWNHDHAYGWMMGVLFHELGHVDDITRGLHIKLDASLDITAAEEYAHRFACERIMSQPKYIDRYMTEFAPELLPHHREGWCDCLSGFYRVIMGFYIGEILPKFAELPYESVRVAGQRLLDSEEMATYRKFAGNALGGFRQ